MKIFAIIVTYNAMHRGWIDRCLRSLSESTVPCKPVVIDNGSADGTRDYVPANYPDAVWLPQERNLGFGQANNIGLRHALEHQADYVLLLNQDAAIAPDAIARMLEASDGKSLLSPLHLNGDGTRIDEMFRISLRNANNLMNDDLLIRHTLAPSYETGEICAACWLMPIALVKDIGGFNPLFFHYSEDNNYYHRMTYHGVKTLLVPSTSMRHDRQLQGNMRAWNHLRLRRDLLLEACNINQGLAGCIWKWGKILLNCYARRLAAHQYRIGAYTIEMLWIIAHLRSIMASRKKEKGTGPTWLQ